ncbi:hypothetical protein T484DRAFT_1772586, partial [Baffinella frigidus]
MGVFRSTTRSLAAGGDNGADNLPSSTRKRRSADAPAPNGQKSSDAPPSLLALAAGLDFPARKKPRASASKAGATKAAADAKVSSAAAAASQPEAATPASGKAPRSRGKAALAAAEKGDVIVKLEEEDDTGSNSKRVTARRAAGALVKPEPVEDAAASHAKPGAAAPGAGDKGSKPQRARATKAGGAAVTTAVKMEPGEDS